MAIVTNRDRKYKRIQNRARSIARRPDAPKQKILEGELKAVSTPQGVFLYTTIGGRTYKAQMPMVLDSSKTRSPRNPVIKLELLSPTWADAKYEMARNLQRILRALGFKDSASKGKITAEPSTGGGSSSSGGGSGEGGGGGGNIPPPVG